MIYTIVNLVALLLGLVLLSDILKKNISDVLIEAIGVLALIVYFLSLARKLFLLDYISIALIVFCAYKTVVSNKFRRIILKQLNYSTFFWLVILLIIYVLTRNITVNHWDEMGVWALETKSIYYWNGFAPTNMHATERFGTYYPLQMLIEWWWCHLQNEMFDEGLMYVGYYSLYIVYLSPMINYVLRKLKQSYYVVAEILVLLIVLFVPGMVDINGYCFLSVELLMTSCFATALFLIMKEDCLLDRYSCLQLGAVIIQLMFLKTSGILFVILLFIIWIIYNYRRIVAYDRIIKLQLNMWILSVGISLLLCGTWKWFCITNNRKSFYQLAISNNLGSIDMLFVKEITKSFIRAVLCEPLHADKLLGLDFTVLLCVVATTILIYINNNLNRNSQVACYYVSIGIVLVGVFAAHIFVFRETQYYASDKMILSISRYAEPVLLGYLLFYLFNIVGNQCIKNKEFSYKYLFVLCMGIMLTTNYKIVNERFNPYIQKIVAEQRSLANDEIIQRNANFVSSIENIAGRIGYIVDSKHSISELDKRYLPYLIVPHSVFFIENINEDEWGGVKEKYGIDYVWKDEKLVYIGEIDDG